MATPVLFTSALKYRWRCLDSNYREAKHVSSATTLHYTTTCEDIYATGKTPKKLVQVVQELHATVDIYCPKNHLEIEEFYLQEGRESNPQFQN